MHYNSDQLLRGIINYADNEVINTLPTSGKWMLGTALGVASSRAADMVHGLKENSMAKAMGIVDEDGYFDIDLIVNNMKESARRYGRMTISIPLVGSMTFSEGDIDTLRDYIERA